jgi:hypothetical protein
MSGTTDRTILALVPPCRNRTRNLTVVVGADLEGLVTAHDEASLLVLLVLQQTDITGTTLLPLLGLAVELEQLGAHLEGLLLKLFVGLGLNLLSQANDGLEVDVGGLLNLILHQDIIISMHRKINPS